MLLFVQCAIVYPGFSHTLSDLILTGRTVLTKLTHIKKWLLKIVKPGNGRINI